MDLKRENVEAYLQSIFGNEVRLKSFRRMGETIATTEDVKGFGYGSPLLVEFTAKKGKKGKEGNRSAVLSTMRVQYGFGHDHFSDRGAVLLWQHDAFNRLPGHVRSLDVGYFDGSGQLTSCGDAREFFLLMEKVDGQEYFYDLERIKEHGATDLDLERVVALADYLARIHRDKKDLPALYQRKIRDLVGHGECIMGILDDYPESPAFLFQDELAEIEKLCVEWRWRLRGMSHRLCQTHGDFHPWNVMFREGTDFTVLDRSRGEFGEAADDITAMTMNYIFYSVQKSFRLSGALKDLFELFFESYLDRTGDEELFRVIGPFFAFRAMVVASPTWYPLLGDDVRRTLFNFVENVLRTEEFDYLDVNNYMLE
ncbi:MAG: Phosphotransferase enzyme family protein [Methanosaeta sp. PtaB.Bin039]|nr:MAG: Phosphotransferase enzyme family protein [Methanosaeta sp. PtaB.Bin039]OPY45403.1 MAG: Phosphotransferase enzyme family protein [Methanosaeta sp. PtaU1.Bin028]HOT07540.1 phosphotransferase [Methanotrichaceae archaeon]HQI53787.1 phosphotransferase [Methanothrix soehngenii]HQF16434.1 phosphotransferase [Methanotrichaceae archaeon]